MDHVQIIKSPGGEEMVVLSRKDYDRLTHAAYDEDARDAALASVRLGRLNSGLTELIPEAVVRAIAVDGVHPIRAWRDYRGLTTEQLARKAKLARTTISQMETGKRKGTIAAHKAIAKALGIGVESLIE